MCWPETPVTVAPVLTGSPEGGGREREREREKGTERDGVCVCVRSGYVVKYNHTCIYMRAQGIKVELLCKVTFRPPSCVEY